jgi:hypothetical protein
MAAIILCRSFGLPFAIQKYTDQDIHNYNFACCFVKGVEHGLPTGGGN